MIIKVLTRFYNNFYKSPLFSYITSNTLVNNGVHGDMRERRSTKTVQSGRVSPKLWDKGHRGSRIAPLGRQGRRDRFDRLCEPVRADSRESLGADAQIPRVD